MPLLPLLHSSLASVLYYSFVLKAIVPVWDVPALRCEDHHDEVYAEPSNWDIKGQMYSPFSARAVRLATKGQKSQIENHCHGSK